MISRKTNISLKLLSVFLAATMLAGCSFTHETEETKHKRTKHTTEETEDIEETEITKKTEASTDTPQPSLIETETKTYVLDNSDVCPIMADVLLFMYDPDQVYRCDANGDGDDDYILYKEGNERLYFLCCVDGGSVCTAMFSSDNFGIHLNYSSGINKLLVHKTKGVMTYGYDEYCIFDGYDFIVDSSYTYWVKEDSEEFKVDGKDATRVEFESRMASYGNLTELSPVSYDTSRKTDIPSDMIPDLRDQILLMTNGYDSSAIMKDVNGDGVQDCMISVMFHHDEWMNLSLSTSYINPDEFFCACSFFLVSNNDHIDIVYPSDAKYDQYKNSMQNG